MKRERLDLEDIVLDVSNIFSLNVEDKGGEIDVDLDASEAMVLADKVHLTNIIYNLMENAVKYRQRKRCLSSFPSAHITRREKCTCMCRTTVEGLRKSTG